MPTLPGISCTCTPVTRYACGHCYHDQCLDCGFCTIGGCVCHCEHGLGFHPSDNPAAGPTFWLGAHHPRWLATVGLPLMVSRRSLADRRSVPRAAEAWVLDSGGFTELSLNGRDQHEVAMRILKVTEEAGEVASAYIGMTGQNPRKGVTHTIEDVQGELCDVILTAAVALASLSDDPAGVFDAKIRKVTERAEATR
ncbi:MazG-like family protein [Streptomyces scopuliridis]|uniref:MazG-like family protein n=1 Tax=Streptomyces scopuliridis TaxID=452529 RepID=UPI00368EBCA1